MAKVRLTCNRPEGPPGTILDLPSHKAQRLVACGEAVAVSPTEKTAKAKTKTKVRRGWSE